MQAKDHVFSKPDCQGHRAQTIINQQELREYSSHDSILR